MRDADIRSPKQFDYFGAKTWTWDQTGVPSRFELSGDTGLCLAVRGEAKVDAGFEIIKCDQAPKWSLVKVDEHGSRIKLDGTGTCLVPHSMEPRADGQISALRGQGCTTPCSGRAILPIMPMSSTRTSRSSARPEQRRKGAYR